MNYGPERYWHCLKCGKWLSYYGVPRHRMMHFEKDRTDVVMERHKGLYITTYTYELPERLKEAR